MLTQKQKIVKRGFDIVLSLLLLPIILIPLLILWILSTLSTGCNGWFVQLRIGQHGKPFSFYKLRTLQGENHKDINEIKAYLNIDELIYQNLKDLKKSVIEYNNNLDGFEDSVFSGIYLTDIKKYLDKYNCKIPKKLILIVFEEKLNTAINAHTAFRYRPLLIDDEITTRRTKINSENITDVEVNIITE